MVIGVIAIVAFDAATAFAAREIGFPYARAIFGSYAIYFTIGLLAARTEAPSPVRSAIAAAAAAGLADASLGWAVSWALGPGRLPQGAILTPGKWLATAVFVVIVAGAIGAVGGGIAAPRLGPRAPAA
jgi:hypothetical protein